MPESAKVTIRFGPYRSCGTVEHRTHRLEGLQVLLKENGHTVDLEPSDDWHDVVVVVNGETVYKCDIRKLEFGGDGQLDQLCHEALEAVNKAF
ncbi:putative UPF0728 protein C10orf53-like [Apostichopus japonicus]|uniref:Putative UPF0728 protein C10orf53-like n=1 Tax=Stichopus japonicus TaxID=307972 RepID=A0A2G8KEZ3_STIJA|nr:putative UPF0728 protein C10orf53-like [Apostichopus japonicus]